MRNVQNYFGLVFLLILSACAAAHDFSLDNKLTPEGEKLLKTQGLAVDPKVRFGAREGLNAELIQYVRKDGKVIILPINGCCDDAANIMFLITLGIFPTGGNLDVNVKDPNSSQIITTKYEEQLAGWIAIPLAILPSWGFDTDEKAFRLYNEGLITSINKMALSGH